MSQLNVKAIVEETAKEAKNNVKNPSSYSDEGHNQFRNEFCRLLDPKLKNIGINFERDRNFGDLKPNVFIPGHYTIDVLAKKGGINSQDIEKANKYRKATGLPTLIASLATQGDSHVREF